MSTNEEMEKRQEVKESAATMPNIDLVWDSRSSLYDCFELNSFKRQLNSALSSRSFSMPHLSDSDRRAPPLVSITASSSSSLKKKSTKISRLIHKFIRSIFKPKSTSLSNPIIKIKERTIRDDTNRCTGLSTIPESPEMYSSRIDSLARRTVSDRFIRPTSLGISCA